MSAKSINGYWAWTRQPAEKGTARYVATSGWAPTIAFDALCEDGRVRRVRPVQSADTFFSHPGRVTFGRVTRKGYVTFLDNVYRFRTYPLAEELIEQFESAGFDSVTTVDRYTVRVHCSRCEVTRINGIFTHETGCPNEARARRMAECDNDEE